MTDLSPGQVISLPDGRHATVRFIGTTHFAPGDWIGIELDDATGKNDGAVQGERYFDCEQGYGMFIRPSAVAAVMERRPPTRTTTAKAGANGVPPRGRPQSGVVGGTAAKRQSLLSSAAGKRQSMTTASPSPAPRPGAPSTQRTLRVRKTWALGYAAFLSDVNYSLLPNLQQNNLLPRPAFAPAERRPHPPPVEPQQLLKQDRGLAIEPLWRLLLPRRLPREHRVNR
jgi:hypothetical protein